MTTTPSVSDRRIAGAILQNLHATGNTAPRSKCAQECRKMVGMIRALSFPLSHALTGESMRQHRRFQINQKFALDVGA